MRSIFEVIFSLIAQYKMNYAPETQVSGGGGQSGKRYGASDKIDGKLYSIDSSGEERILLDGLILSNGLEWSMDEKKFYHADSDTHMIKEYSFGKESGNIEFTGRQVRVDGVDGFTIDKDERILAACWGKGHIAMIDTKSMEITGYFDIPAKLPASCGFSGEGMEYLAIVTANYGTDINTDVNAGFTFICETGLCGRKPYLFG